LKPEVDVTAVDVGRNDGAAANLPRYEELPLLGDSGERHAWDAFGRDDEFGCLNHIDAAKVAVAAAEVRSGEVVNLNLPVGEPQPQFWATRPAPQYQTIVRRNVRDDYIDSFYTQGSTQWDGFRHIRFRQFGFYGGRQDDALDQRGELGVGAWAERGLISRGVLVDVARHLALAGAPLDPQERLPIGPELTEEVLAAQQTTIAPGDILLFRTGWLEWYRALAEDTRTELATRLDADRGAARLPGLDPGREMAAWLWDNRVAAVAFDNPTAEALPHIREVGWAHHRLLALLGLPLGELWDLSRLSPLCAAAERHTFMLTTAPINLPRGVASPANAYAIL
jgi:kynurenine formamidase